GGARPRLQDLQAARPHDHLVVDVERRDVRDLARDRRSLAAAGSRHDHQDARRALPRLEPERRQDLVQDPPRLAGGRLLLHPHLGPHQLAREDQGEARALEAAEDFRQKATRIATALRGRAGRRRDGRGGLARLCEEARQGQSRGGGQHSMADRYHPVKPRSAGPAVGRWRARKSYRAPGSAVSSIRPRVLQSGPRVRSDPQGRHRMSRTATYEDANLILRLYEMRREDRMRAARAWFVASCHVRSPEELLALAPPGSEANASFRMVTSYWEMVASFITRGVLDPELFFQSGQEIVLVWERIKDLVPISRANNKGPHLFRNLETVA